ncbi:hypothetical protein ACIBW9_32825 [Streptomyces sp. NPDC049541]|uniref:hypothetical protein n=1 Tax=Streptomyces sp. NPDC049541 TaxID=3365594 RepID=UPI00379664B1
MASRQPPHATTQQRIPIQPLRPGDVHTAGHRHPGDRQRVFRLPGLHEPRAIPVHDRRKRIRVREQYDDCASNPDGNAYVTRIDWNTGSTSDRQLTKAGQSLYYREPEGLAIQIPDTSNTAACRLAMGFASENSATDTDKMASFYYESSLI